MELNNFINIKKRENKISFFDIKMILSNFYNIEISDLINCYNKIITQEEIEKLNYIIEERIKGKPISKIFNKKYFWNYCFFVNKDVLDPRPDSEIMIEEIIKKYNKNDKLKILDLGSGSGCLIITLLKLFENATGIAVDISEKALNVVEKNAKNLDVDARLNLIRSNWNDKIDDKFDVIISNPPYIETDFIEKLDIDVKNFDPLLALDGGIDGLKCYKYIAKNIRKNCKENTKIFLEIGYNQKNEVISLFEQNGFKFVKLTKDYGNNDRIVEFML